MTKEKKLSTKDKLEIALSQEESLRTLAEKYSIHHSTVEEIRKESMSVLSKYFEEKSKRIGRPPKPEKPEELKKAEKQIESLEYELAVKSMKMEWAELQLKWEKERVADEKRKKRNQLKKRRKKRK